MHLGTSTPTPQFGGSRGSAAPVSARRHAETTAETIARIDWTDDLKRRPKDTGQQSAAKELDEAIADFYNPASAGSSAESKAESRPIPAPSPSAHCSDLEVMIAIEPDPAHTRLALWFDRDLDTLGDALQETGYQYQANWMPWSAEGASSVPGDRFLDREQQRLFVEGREQMPGVLLYRPGKKKIEDTHDACPPKYLEIFIVGNSPTSGINSTQFREAIRQFARRSQQQDKLKILGPSFSGSSASLRSLVQEIPTLLTSAGSANPKPALKSIEIASGSITDPDCSHFLPNPAGNDPACHVTIGGIETSFVSFAPDTDTVIMKTEDFLEKFRHGNIPYSRMAVLAEDESSFGLNVRDVGRNLGNLSRRAAHAQEPDRKSDERARVLNLTYPRGISHLRSAYQKSSIWGFGGTTEGSGSVNLNLDFDESTIDEDSVPVFAQQQMPVSQESNVYQLTTLLRERGVQAVILSGTDVLDVIFVAQILARQAPNLLIVIWEADDLFLRSATNNVFRNIYFVGSWPLISENYFWSLPSYPPGAKNVPQFRNFVSDNAEGFHVAAHYLLREGDATTLDVPDYHSPFRNSTVGHPPLWLCSEDKGRFWPIALLGEDSAEPHGPDFHQPDLTLTGNPAGLAQSVYPPASQRFFLILLALMSMAHLYFCLDRSQPAATPGPPVPSAPHPPRKLPIPQNLRAHYLTNDPVTRKPKLLLLLAITLLGLGMLFMLVPAGRYSSFCASTVIPSLISLVCLSKTAALLLIRLRNAAPGKLGCTIISLLVAAASASLWFFLWWLTSSSTDLDGIDAFFAYRVTQPLSGTSPLLPLFLASAGLVYALYSHLGRLNFTAQLTPRLPPNSTAVPNIPDQQATDRVTSSLHYPPTEEKRAFKTVALASISVVALVLCFAAGVSPRLFDGPILRATLTVVIAVVLIAILWDLTMASVIWSSLSVNILQPLENSSLRRAFNAIGGLTWKSFWMPQNSIAQYRAIFRLLEQAERKPLQPESLVIAAEGRILKVQAEQLWAALKTQPHYSPPILAAFDSVQQSVQTLAESLLEDLRTHWQRETVPITASDLVASKEEDAPSEKPTTLEARLLAREEWVALVYLHFSRMVLAQIRTRLMTAAVLYFFLVSACTSYPFLNRHLILIALSVTLGILSAVGITIFASINRDAVLSRVTKNTPGELDWDFLIKTASLIGIPILTFVASQFPEFGSFLFSWIQPGMNSLK